MEENKPNYRITITKVVPNPEYVREMEQRERQGRHYQFDTTPNPTVTVDVLISEITEDQYKVVKAEILKVF